MVYLEIWNVSCNVFLRTFYGKKMLFHLCTVQNSGFYLMIGQFRKPVQQQKKYVQEVFIDKFISFCEVITRFCILQFNSMRLS